MLTDKPKTATHKTKANKFPLLIYKRYHQVNRGLSILIMLASLLLIAAVILLRFIRPRALSGDSGLLLGGGAILFVFGLARYLLTAIFSRLAYVQCTPRNVKIQTPLMPVVFSYKRVSGTRPTALRDVFVPDKQKGLRRRMLEEVWGETVIVVDLKGYPMSKSWLRTLMGPLLLTPRGTGFVLLVKDWMGLNRQIADYQEQWRARTSTSVAPAQRGYYRKI
jgi:hypothetical protein